MYFYSHKSEKSMKRIILITGGARSGKSSHAEKLALAFLLILFTLLLHASGTKNSGNASSAISKDVDRNGQISRKKNS